MAAYDSVRNARVTPPQERGLRSDTQAVISVIIPAYNEGRVIGRLLSRLIASAHPGELDVIVVPNGCTDDTVAVAAAFGPPVRVLSIASASKPGAIAAGDRAARGFPRVYLDADVEIGAEDLRAMQRELQRPGVLAAAPEREFVMTGRSWAVRWFYDIWTRLPEVQRGLFGRGVIAISEDGHSRVIALQPVIADDLAVSLAFEPYERVIVSEARVLIHPPKTFADLLRRRMRVTESTAQIKTTPGMPSPDISLTRPSSLSSLARTGPMMTLQVCFFLFVSMIAKIGAKRSALMHDYSVWHRDESSRQ
jgi:Glycosyl transferase family 2